MNDLWWVTPVVLVLVVAGAIWMGVQQAKRRAEYAIRQKAEWKAILASHGGKRGPAAIDYRAKYGDWPGDWNRSAHSRNARGY